MGSVRRLEVRASVKAAASAIGVTALLVVAGAVDAPVAAVAATPVHCPTDSLQTAIDNANPGAILQVSGTCEGNFAINKDLTLIGTPGAVLSADDDGVVITIPNPHTITIRSIEITDGQGTMGGGIEAPDAGPLTLDHVTFDDNVQIATTEASGGAVLYVGSDLTITHCTFTANQAEVYGANGQFAQGGAVWARGKTAIDHTTFTGNRAVVSASTSTQALSQGGAVEVDNGPLTITSSAFTDNSARATLNSTTADALGAVGGGGLFVETAAVKVSVTHTAFIGNSVTAFAPFAGGSGAGASFGMDFEGTLALSHDTFADNQVRTTITGPDGGNSSSAGLYVDAGTAHLTHLNVRNNTVKVTSIDSAQAHGGGMDFVADLGAISDSTFAHNSVSVDVRGNAAGEAAFVSGGGARFATDARGLTVSSSTFADNSATASAAKAGSDSRGGGVDINIFTTASDKNRIVNSTFSGNAATVHGPGHSRAEGGAISSTDPGLRLQFDTIVANRASGGPKQSYGGGVFWSNTGMTPASIEASLVLDNTAGAGSSCAGALKSLGFNAFGSLARCSIGKKHTDRTKVSVKKAELGKLAANGGPTKTMALHKGSIALDRIPRSACRAIARTDQRGVPRPQGTLGRRSKCDEGAYELRR